MARVEGDMMLGGRYRLVRSMASGGMGTVWEAGDEVLHRRVAVKVLSDALASNETASERFRREARAAAGLSHPNVAGVFDYGEDDGTQFMVMELVDGETLAERLRREGRVPPGEAARIAAQVADALQAAHDTRIVHRDVKPGNIILTPQAEVKVLDFGIAAAATGSTLTLTGFTMGTAAYISPEQASGERATAASDVYSLGAVLYEMLTGRPPFTAESPVALAAAHASRSPRPVRDLAPDVPEHLARACQQAMAKDPAARPPSARALADLLRAEETETAAVPTPPTTAVLPVDGKRPHSPATTLPIETAPDGRPQRKGIRSLWVFLGGLALLAVVAVAAARVYGPGPLPVPGVVEVPEVIGMSPAAAAQRLGSAGLPVGSTRVVSAGGAVQGTVVRTDPRVGASVPAGTPVTLFVAGPPPPSVAPSGEDGHGKGKGKHKGGD